MTEPRDPVRDAFDRLRDVRPDGALTERVRSAVATTPQAPDRSIWPAIASVAAAAALIVAVAVPGVIRFGSPRATPSGLAATASPTASPQEASSVPVSAAPEGLAADDLARVTKEFGIARGAEALPGQSVLIVAGPTDHDGRESYLVQWYGDLTTGYRSDGVEGWIPATTARASLVERNPICPAGRTLEEVARLQPFERLRCLSGEELTFEPVAARDRFHGARTSSRWISTDGNPDFFTGLPVYGLTPATQMSDDGWYRVTGHFDDPASIECGEPGQVAWCRERFIVTNVVPVEPPVFVIPGTWARTGHPPLDGRTDHALVWTGAEAVVWGGTSSSDKPGHSTFDGVLPRDGAAYDPATNRWRLIPDAPIGGRHNPIAVWTGREVLVFGGWVGADEAVLDGAAFDPAANRWRTIARSPLDGRGTVGAWLAGRLVVVTSTAAASYDPRADAWETLPPASIEPMWRSAVVAGGRLVMVAFGEGGATSRVEWAAWDPTAARWTHGDVPIDPLMAGVTLAATNELAVFPETGLTFDPRTETWATTLGCHGAGAAPAWTGSVLIALTVVWDQRVGECRDLPPAPNRAAPFDNDNGREFPVAVWTGRQYITWSGGTGGDIVWVPNDGAVFTPDLEHDLGPCCG